MNEDCKGESHENGGWVHDYGCLEGSCRFAG